MSEKQRAIARIQSLNVEDLQKALTNYGVQKDAINLFASKNITGSNLLRLNITNILQWRCEIGIAKCNAFQKVIEKIQSDPEKFVFKAIETPENKQTPKKAIEKQLQTRKPLPNPRPFEFLPLPLKRNKDNNECKDVNDEKEEMDEKLLIETVDFVFKDITDAEDSVNEDFLLPNFGENTVAQNDTSQ